LDRQGLPVMVEESLHEGARGGSPMPHHATTAAGAIRQRALWPATTSATETARRVEEILEIWRVDDEWWRKFISRRYVEVVLEKGGHVVLFEDLVTNEWFMQRP
jgi:hypothetical protein